MLWRYGRLRDSLLLVVGPALAVARGPRLLFVLVKDGPGRGPEGRDPARVLLLVEHGAVVVVGVVVLRLQPTPGPVAAH